MDFQVWLTFVSASFILSVIPGPSVLVVTGQAIANGRRSALFCILGEVLGGVCLMLVSLLGVGAALAASPFAFLVLKWLGVIFLVYIGLKALWCAVWPSGKIKKTVCGGDSFKAGFLTAILNPKSLMFYFAFLSQFVNTAMPLPLQYMLLIGTAATVAAIVLGAYAFSAVWFRPFVSSPSAQRKVSGMSGVLYISGGALVAASR